jgi:hypothetical protein
VLVGQAHGTILSAHAEPEEAEVVTRPIPHSRTQDGDAGSWAELVLVRWISPSCRACFAADAALDADVCFVSGC